MKIIASDFPSRGRFLYLPAFILSAMSNRLLISSREKSGIWRKSRCMTGHGGRGVDAGHGARQEADKLANPRNIQEVRRSARIGRRLLLVQRPESPYHVAT